ncbi:MAG: iron-sulfur cluster assembly scaffold protein [Deltaproteobacteria bacterium]
MYSESVLDHFHNPRNVGEISNATAAIEMTNPVCGDLMKLWAVVRDGRIAEAKFKTEGCIPAVACGSCLTEMMNGKSCKDLAAVTAEEIEAALGGLPAASKHASRLAADALQKLLQEINQMN